MMQCEVIKAAANKRYMSLRLILRYISAQRHKPPPVVHNRVWKT